MKTTITTEQAVAVAYECGRAFRDHIDCKCGVGKPWGDLNATERAAAADEFFANEGPDARMDQKLVNLISPFLQKLIEKK